MGEGASFPGSNISFLRFFKTRGTLLFPVPVTESQVPKVNRLRRKSNLPSKLQCKLHSLFFVQKKSEDLRIPGIAQDIASTRISNPKRLGVCPALSACSGQRNLVGRASIALRLVTGGRGKLWLAQQGPTRDGFFFRAPSTFLVWAFSKLEVLCCFRCLLQKAKLQK